MAVPEDRDADRTERDSPADRGSSSEVTSAGNNTVLVSDDHVSPEEKKQILRDRAKRLAVRPEADRETEQTMDVVELRLAGERYAIEMSYIREVCPLKDLTPVPCTPSFILGVINVRGQLLSVTDLRELFDLSKNELTEDARVIIVMNDEMELGILGESIIGERNIPVSRVRSEVANLTGMRDRFIKGVTNERLAVLDIASLLTDNRIVVNEEVG